MSRQNYFNTLTMAQKLDQLGRCRFMDRSEFNGVEKLRGKKVVIVGCGAQGLNQGLNMRDSGLDISYALRADAIAQKRVSFTNATSNGFKVGTYEELIPTADLVCNLAPDKQHADVVQKVMPLMKKGACLAYSHGFNIVEEGQQIRKDLTVVMVAPKCPGTEVREEYKRGFGVPTLIAVHQENDPNGDGLEIAKAYAAATGGDRAGVLESSFIAEVKSDLMGEQTILCGMLQTGSILCFDRMVAQGIDRGYASKLVQFGWETITEALKQGGLSLMMDWLSNPAKVKAFELAEELRGLMRTLYKKHQDDIITGVFSTTMMKDWDAGDVNLLGWRAATSDTAFEQTPAGAMKISEQEYFDHAVLMVAMVKAGVELAFECMVEVGMKPESRLLRVAARGAAHRQPDLAQEAVRDEQGHQRHRRVRLLPVQPRRRAALEGVHEPAVDRGDRQGLRARQPAGGQPALARREPGHREPPGREGRRHAARPHDGDEADLRRWLSATETPSPTSPSAGRG